MAPTAWAVVASALKGVTKNAVPVVWKRSPV